VRDVLTCFGLDDWIYWHLVHTACDYTLQFTVSHRQVSFVNYSLQYLLPDNGFNGGRSPFSGLPIWPVPQLPASNSKSSYQLNRSGHLTPTSYSPLRVFTFNWTTIWLQFTSSHQLLHVTPLYNHFARTDQKTPFQTVNLLCGHRSVA
jgi:hypothetical protein